LKNITVHPDGASTLVTDADGIISGSFIVPNNDTTKIKTGTRQFKILDISVDKEQDAASVTSASYTASGFIDTKQAEYTSTRIIHRPYYGLYGDIADNGGSGDHNGGYTVYQTKDGTWNSKGVYSVDANGHRTEITYNGGGFSSGTTGPGGYLGGYTIDGIDNYASNFANYSIDGVAAPANEYSGNNNEDGMNPSNNDPSGGLGSWF